MNEHDFGIEDDYEPLIGDDQGLDFLGIIKPVH